MTSISLNCAEKGVLFKVPRVVMRNGKCSFGELAAWISNYELLTIVSE